MTRSYFLEGVDRAMKVLDAFSAETPELRLTDLSNRLGIPKPQVLRIVSTLEHGGYLERDPHTKRYRLGIRLFQLGMVVQQTMDIRRIALPWLRKLAAETQETVGLFVPDSYGPVCIDVIDSPKGLRVFAQVGRRMPWNAGTAAKVILAYLPDDQREAILARDAFKRYTPQTITEPEQLRAMCETIRCQGFHVAVRDLDDDALGVGAPIFNHEGHIAAALSIGAPVSRTCDGDLARYSTLVREAAYAVSRQLGYHRDDDDPWHLARPDTIRQPMDAGEDGGQ
ncbi:MAG: hypothetical protein C4346_17835 [Chloroflexota bacterium]